MEDFIFGKNKYGEYAVPKTSSYRPASVHILRGSVWEQKTIDYISSLNLNNEIIHAGTYFGDFLPFLSQTFKKVWAFEISDVNHNAALKTLELNNIDNVSLNKFALGDVESFVNIQTNISGKDLGGTSKVINYDSGTSIKQVKLDDIIPKDSKIDIIHLDIEGSEINAIKGAMELIIRNKPILILEDNNNDVQKNWFKQNIIALGYKKVLQVDENKVFKYEN